jgi:molecular chaperone DnaK (HSP70)
MERTTFDFFIDTYLRIFVGLVLIGSYLTFTNILLQVSAQDKASGKIQKITITSEKGRLSEDEIERMLKEAEENAEADKIARQTVEAKNQLESYLYSLRSTLDDEAMKEKIVGEDRDALTTSVTEALIWLEEHTSDEKEAFDIKRREVEDIANPILTKVYSAEPAPGPETSGPGPTVEEPTPDE